MPTDLRYLSKSKTATLNKDFAREAAGAILFLVLGYITTVFLFCL